MSMIARALWHIVAHLLRCAGRMGTCVLGHKGPMPRSPLVCQHHRRYGGSMLVLRCAACRRKLWRYLKRGKGEVLRCHKDRIDRMYEAVEREGRIGCVCGRDVGIDRGGHWRMIQNSFTYSGTKTNA